MRVYPENNIRQCRRQGMFRKILFALTLVWWPLLLFNFTKKLEIKEERIQNLENEVISLREKINYIMKDIGNIDYSCPQCLSKPSPLLKRIQGLVVAELTKYDADKTGQPDFALQSAGGRIVNIGNTKTRTSGSPGISFLGVRLCSATNPPETIIQPSTLPGECWAFEGSSGSVIIQLYNKIVITGFSLEHIHPSLSPDGQISTATKEFSMWGLNTSCDSNPTLLGQYIYEIDKNLSVQYFPVQTACSQAFEFVEFKIISNYGEEYTCIYRIRVHGNIPRSPKIAQDA